MPYRFTGSAFFINKTLFDKAGIKYPEKGWTWPGEYLQLAQALTDPAAEQWGTSVPNYQLVEPFLATNDTSALTPDLRKSNFLFLDVGARWATMDTFDADAVYALCHAHPNLPVILVKHRIRYNRQVYHLFEACPNLYMELSGYWHYRAVEELCARFGAERLLFGTNWPYMDSSFAIAMVMYAQVSEAEKAAIASGNLQQLLEAVRW